MTLTNSKAFLQDQLYHLMVGQYSKPMTDNTETALSLDVPSGFCAFVVFNYNMNLMFINNTYYALYVIRYILYLQFPA